MTNVVYREVTVGSALNRVKGMPFEWSLNPFLGCPHACRYCFSRAYHARYREKNVGSDFDSNIEVRVNIADTLRHELRRPKEGSLAIGTATDPYQPIEGKYRLTRKCLEVLIDHPMPIGIVTKGPLVIRDIDLLLELDRKTEVTVFFSVPCVDEEVVRKTDPGTAPPRQRLRALSMLREAGLDAAVLCMPVLPGISDSEESLDRAARAASEAGATAFRHRPLKIDSEIRDYYFDFIASEFPVLAPRYAALYAGGNLPTRDYEKELERRVARVTQRYRFSERPPRRRPEPGPQTEQLQLAM